MESDDEEASYVPGEATVKAFSEQHFGAVASPYVATYVFRTGNVDKVCVEMWTVRFEFVTQRLK